MGYFRLALTGRVARRQWRYFSTSRRLMRDPQLEEYDRMFQNEFGSLKDKYDAPKHPIVLAHGLLGFDELRLAGSFLPGIQYWRGIVNALRLQNIEVITTEVPSSGSIEARAEKLAMRIAEKAGGKSVNIIAGLDSRYMISNLKPENVKVLSLTTIATPHRGSSFADYLHEQLGPIHFKRLSRVLGQVGMESGAFSQLTQKYLIEEFNPKTPDRDDVRYFSYGASLEPTVWSVFWYSHRIIKQREQAMNDGLVSVPSSRWGKYQGTLTGVSHLDLINWTSRVKVLFWLLTGVKRSFNAHALYLEIAGTIMPYTLRLVTH
ncbi:alpha/beta-hydrolase [Eremomyces bilateralis CBS 781.70]|uniref:Alpha/beta-hydrolase n=1 Tax=Eremomyces bilateralis CBS 781.70 TaxID=1392243 RepID=A0A6G1FRN7_9PEZI|nr:alpha/beta-hydrolase [Eremomyces bilateralis CBS 781.70]KAF1808332.1 alpha/beta-hydrolase [Eremomyces bilateralis CBS 781.70]